MIKVADKVRSLYIKELFDYFANKGEDVGMIASNSFNFPIVMDGEELFLEVVVKDKAALDAYQNDPYHCGTVKPYMHKVRSGSVSADYEF